jgi:perosamine synthetase
LVTLPLKPAGKNHSWQSFHVVLDDSLNRDAVIAQLKEKGIGTNYGAQCIPAQIFYQKKYRLDVPALFPNALRAYTQGLVLPLYEKLSTTQIEFIADIINQLK